MVHEALTTVNDGNTSIIDVQVTNNTDHNIILPGRTVLGRLQLVRSITLVEVRLTDTEVTSVSLGEAYQVERTKPSLVDHCKLCSARVVPSKMTDCSSVKLPDVDLSGLTPDQQEQVRQLLRDEADTSARNEDDVSTVPALKMDINLTSNEPVQKNYLSIAIHCIQRLKHMSKTFLIEDLFENRSRPSPAALYVFKRRTVECDYALTTAS